MYGNFTVLLLSLTVVTIIRAPFLLVLKINLT